MVYVLGAVKPNVKRAAEEAGQMFAVGTILGVGLRPNESDHPKGLALDFMVGLDRSKGDAIAAYFLQNQRKYGVKYVIWKQHIWSVGRASEGWRAMENRGSVTANHFDHVHVSFYAPNQFKYVDDPVAPGPIDPVPPGDPRLPPGIGGGLGDVLSGIKAAIDAIGNGLKWIADPHNWLRLGMFVLGALLLLLALVLFGKGKVLNA